MKKTNLILKRAIFTLIAGSMFTIQSMAQSFGDILAAGVTDAGTYLESYVAPAMNSFGVGLAVGWNATAKPHKLLGFDVTFTVNIANVPENQRTFAYNQADYSNLRYTTTAGSTTVAPNGTLLPTLIGGPASGQFFLPANQTITDPSSGQSITIQNELRFDAIDGFDLSDLPMVGVPVPNIQLGIGLIKNTDIKIRMLPPGLLAADDFNAPKYFGIGVLHDIKQWIPGMKLVPVDISALYGFTTFSVGQDININSTSSDATATTSFVGNGTASLSARATTFQVIASKKLALFTPFVSVGFNSVRSGIKVDGEYDYTVTPAVGSAQSLLIRNPVDLEFTGAGGPRMSFGGRLKILVLTIHAEYTIQQFNTFTAGVGVALR